LLTFIFLQTYFVKIPVSALSNTSDPVTFASYALEEVIREKLNKSTGPITISDMESLNDLFIFNFNVRNLSGLEYAVNLTKLNIMNSQVESITPIKNLTKLTDLHISTMRSSGKTLDITVLDNLTNLKNLVLMNQSLKDISPLSRLKDLESVDLSNNMIEDLTPLTLLQNLKTVNLDTNKITDISTINQLTSIEYLNLTNNEIKDITPLLKFAESGHIFNSISLTYNYLDITEGSSTLSQLEKLSKYSTYYFYENQKLLFKDDKLRLKLLEALGESAPEDGILTNYSLLSSNELNLDDSDLSDLTELQFAKNLSILSLNNNNVKDLGPLKNLNKLTVLSAEGNYIQDTNALKNMTALHYLNLKDNYIDNIAPLSNLTNLEILGLNANLVSDTSPLKVLNKLQILDLGYNLIKDINEIRNLTALKILTLEGNNVLNIEALRNMKSLQVLGLRNNNITDISVLNSIKANGAFSMESSAIDLEYNYLDLSAGSEQSKYIINLQSGGTEVMFEHQLSSLNPKVIMSNPNDGDLGFNIDLPITLKFDKTLEAGENIDYINIVDETGNFIDFSTVIDRDTVIVTPNVKLESGKRYILQIPLNAFKSKADGSNSDDFTAVFTTMPKDENKYRVIFNSQGGSIIATNITDNSSVIKTPASPIKIGYIFDGWYKEAQGINLWDFEKDKVTADTTLYARWKAANNNVITFNTKEGSAIEQQSVLYNGKASKPSEPVRGGYTFAGWYTDQFPFTKAFDFSNTRVTESVTLYSKWVPTEAYVMSYLDQSKETKLFGIYNQAKAVIYESDLSEVKKGYYLGELAKLDSAVFTQINRYFIDRCNAIAANPNLTDFLALVDEIDAKLTTDIDRGYFKGEMNSWGRYRVYTSQVQTSIAAIGEVWTLKTDAAVEKAKEAIAAVQETGSVTWLNGQLNEAVQAISK
jgi:uncharacterized repeat protein (TIGR02543 family)